MPTRVSAKRRLERYEPGKASEYLTHIGDLPLDRTHAVLHLRVSTNDQKDNLHGYEEFLRGLVEAKGHHLLSVTCEVARGEVSDRYWRWRHKLIRSLQIAREHPNGYVLACSMCRIIRHADMTKHNQGILPTVEDFECLAEWAGEVPLVTAWHPDIDYREIKRLQDALFNSNNPGRPKKKRPGETKRRTTMNRSRVFWMRSLGYSAGEIAALLGVDRSQVYRWWNQLKRGSDSFADGRAVEPSDVPEDKG